jgi:hypothetical protein
VHRLSFVVLLALARIVLVGHGLHHALPLHRQPVGERVHRFSQVVRLDFERDALSGARLQLEMTATIASTTEGRIAAAPAPHQAVD